MAKHKFAPYGATREDSTWLKIKNRAYSQMQGREELFERDRYKEPVPGWHTCEGLRGNGASVCMSMD